MKKYAYMITIVLLSFSCSRNTYPTSTQVQTEQECEPKAMSPMLIVFAAILTATVIISFAR